MEIYTVMGNINVVPTLTKKIKRDLHVIIFNYPIWSYKLRILETVPVNYKSITEILASRKKSTE